jgi:hypothetical protein
MAPTQLNSSYPHTSLLQPPEEMQEVLLSLSYLPSAERLTVVLLKARNLFLPQDKDNIGKHDKKYKVQRNVEIYTVRRHHNLSSSLNVVRCVKSYSETLQYA